MISPTDDGKFIAAFSLVRDHSLDLPDDESLLRPDFVYPSDVGGYNSERTSLNYFKKIPNGWMDAKYECMAWCRTNNLVIPSESKFQVFMFSVFPHPYPYPVFVGELKANVVNLCEIQENDLIPKVGHLTKVLDFRYRRANDTRIYRYADYMLIPGESWKPDNNPSLLAQAARYLKDGPRYNAFLHPNKRNFMAWLPFGAVILTAWVAILWCINKKNKK